MCIVISLNESLVLKEAVVLRGWGRETLKFGIKSQLINVKFPTLRDNETDASRVSTS